MTVKEVQAWRDSRGNLWGSQSEADTAEKRYIQEEKIKLVKQAINGGFYNFDDIVAKAVVINFSAIKKIMEQQ